MHSNLQLLDGHSIWSMPSILNLCAQGCIVLMQQQTWAIFALLHCFCSKVWFLWTLVVRTTATPFLGSSDRLGGNVRAPDRLVLWTYEWKNFRRFCFFSLCSEIYCKIIGIICYLNHTFMGQCSNLSSYSSKIR